MGAYSMQVPKQIYISKVTISFGPKGIQNPSNVDDVEICFSLSSVATQFADEIRNMTNKANTVLSLNSKIHEIRMYAEEVMKHGFIYYPKVVSIKLGAKGVTLTPAVSS